MLVDKSVKWNTWWRGWILHVDTQLILDFKMWQLSQILQNLQIWQGGFQTFWVRYTFLWGKIKFRATDLNPHFQNKPQFSTWKWKWSRSVMSDSLRLHGLQPIRLLRPWDFPGKSAGVDCHFLPQGIFPTRESNPGLPHCRQTLYRLSHQGSPYLLKDCKHDLIIVYQV